MKVYLINLDRSPDRLNFFQSQADRLGLPFERISAVDGRRLTAEELRDAVSVSYEFQPVNAGEIGLFQSHKRAWEKLIDSGEPHAAVFEDDALMSASIVKAFQAIDCEHPVFDVIKLETTLRRTVCSRQGFSFSSGHRLQKLLSWHGGTAGYVISRDCAGRLLELKHKVSDPIDQVMFNPMSKVSRQLNLQQLNPAVCIQQDILQSSEAARFGTTIDRNVSRRGLFRHGPLIDLRRFLKKMQERSRRNRLSADPANVCDMIPFADSQSASRAA